MAKTNSREEFWRDYGKKIGEEVLAYSLGRYLSGWPGEKGPIWGLLIATDGGFRFHHIPSRNWFDAIFRTGAEAPQEKTFHVPSDRILAMEVLREKSFLKRFLAYKPPRLVVRFLDEAGAEAEFVAEGDEKIEALVKKLIPDTL